MWHLLFQRGVKQAAVQNCGLLTCQHVQPALAHIGLHGHELSFTSLQPLRISLLPLTY